eukprot:UN02540
MAPPIDRSKSPDEISDEEFSFEADLDIKYAEIYLSILQLAAVLVAEQVDEDEFDEDALKVPNNCITFDTLGLKKPADVELPVNYNEAFVYFEKAVKHYANALEYYVLDGFVTKHGEIIQDISQLLKHFGIL